MENIEQHIEALIFASEQGIRTEEILYCLQAAFEHDYTSDEITTHINNIRAKYQDESFAVEVLKINNGFQFLTKKKYHTTISLLQLQRSKKKLSQAALETLAIIAYKQPVTKTDIEQIRGVNCDYSIQKLLEKELIAITGKSESVGKPILYGTSGLFMDYFGVNDISELPQLKDITDNSSTIGQAAE
ncbi:SMC-Scp complex subunit ScpB [Mucilaginibacter glaciei]|uniref:SMC-Scp complex subunit ScpB n=1 Tax=Mucilaginibacter glaciei TaxID=2772109 RepID=A0A926NQ50_9SPHI|nr:SMC-Scp complex subunit ScpB [Mucilaginibacter glaciei]MBD1391830.1 SMC-Scp complex subunit ScpB [Mucilaginibacter glaciei]